jgi:hypothetical protein
MEVGYCLFFNVVFCSGWLRLFGVAVRLLSLLCVLLYSKTCQHYQSHRMVLLNLIYTVISVVIYKVACEIISVSTFRKMFFPARFASLFKEKESINRFLGVKDILRVECGPRAPSCKTLS